MKAFVDFFIGLGPLVLQPKQLLAVLLLLSTACMRYPVKPEGTKNYEAVRIEGLPLRQSVKYGIPYWVKYFKKSHFNSDTTSFRSFPQEALHQCIRDSVTGLRHCTHLLFTGDMMWIRNNWSGFLSPALHHHLAQADLLFGNLETPIVPTKSAKHFWPDYARYNASPDLLRSFTDSSGASLFAGLSLANNHATDMGIDGLTATLAFVQSQNITPMGAATTDSLLLYHRFKHQGLHIGIHASSWGLNAPADLENPALKIHTLPGLAYPYTAESVRNDSCLRAISQMRQDGIDVVVLMLHWGYEYEYYPDSNIRQLARSLSAAGADLIIGAHPHVIQPMEYLPKWLSQDTGGASAAHTLVYYSLGNFTTTMFTAACRLGLLTEIAVVKKPGEDIRLEALPPTYVYNHIRGLAGRKRELLLIEPNHRPSQLSQREWRRVRKALRSIQGAAPAVSTTKQI
jgi:hypothetical protein